MNDMSSVIVAKSDQLNGDDLLSGPRTILITGVKITPGTEQPVAISFDGDEGKPWKPCKTCSRILVGAWGADAKAYVGRSLRLYRDPKVTWGGMQVGGIRISHMSDIEHELTMALMASNKKKAVATIKPLEAVKAPATDEMSRALAEQALRSAATLDDLKTAWSRKSMAPHRAALQGVLDECKALLSFDENPTAQEGRADEQHGERFGEGEE
jgi:hypothetical protein